MLQIGRDPPARKEQPDLQLHLPGLTITRCTSCSTRPSTLWEKSLQMDPDNLAVIHNLALATEKSGDRDKARPILDRDRQALEAQLDQARARTTSTCATASSKCKAPRRQGPGERAQRAETKQEALEQYQEILKINPARILRPSTTSPRPCWRSEVRRGDPAAQGAATTAPARTWTSSTFWGGHT